MRRAADPWCLAAVLGLFAALSWAGVAAAHPYSTSRGEMDWNADTGRFEVALEVLPEELVAMVSHELEAPFRLDTSPACDAAIAAYLARHFLWIEADDQPATLIFAGKELDFAATWLYFELAPRGPRPSNLAGLRLRVDLGLELTHQHLTALRIRFGEEEQGLLFSLAQPELRLPPPTPLLPERNLDAGQ